MTPLRRLAEPEEVAAAICFLASPAAAMITGHTSGRRRVPGAIDALAGGAPSHGAAMDQIVTIILPCFA